jgi:predicted nuclease of predicted toxin-antitoxin system
MRFMIDNQLPARLAGYLRGRGHQCVHVADIGMDDSHDAEVWHVPPATAHC